MRDWVSTIDGATTLSKPTMAGKLPLKAVSLPKDYVISGVQVLDTKTLGRGSYGVVYLGRYRGLLCAVKKLQKFVTENGLDQLGELVLRSFYNESEKLCKLRHPNIVQLLGLYLDGETRLPVIVMELMHESLSRLLYRTKSLPLYVEVNIVHDVALALAYLHALHPPIVHRDLSSNNILLTQEFRAKITDLGVAKVDNGSFLNWNNTPAPGTLAYMPPEVRRIPADLSPAMDIFAVGVNVLQIVTHKHPDPGPELASGVLGFSKMVPERERRRDHISLVSKSHTLRPLLLECLKDAAKDRPTAVKLCQQLEQVKTSKSYLDSLQVANIELDQMSAAMQRIATLERTVEDLTQELSEKTNALERTSEKLKEEQEFTARLLSERAQAQLNEELSRLDHHTPQLSTCSAKEESDVATKQAKAKRRLPFNLKRFRRQSKKSPSDPTPKEVSSQDTVSSPSSEPELESENELPDQLDEEPDTTEQPPVEVYKQRQMVWTSHNCLPCGLQGSTLRLHLCDQRLYLCGGAREDSTPNREVLVSRVDSLSRWETLKPNPSQHHSASVIIHNQLVLVGGLDSVTGQCTGTLSSYDGETGTWVQRLPPLPTPRASAAAFVSGDYLVVIGGERRVGELVNVVEVLHIPSSRWEAATRLPQGMAGQSVALCGNEVYLLGGIDKTGPTTRVYVASIPKILSSCRFFSLFAGTDRTGQLWRQLSESPFPLMTAVSFEENLFGLGGQEVTGGGEQPAGLIWLCSLEEEEGEGVWSPVQRLPSGRQLCCAVVLPDHRLVIAGGLPQFTTVDIAQMAV